MLIRAKAPLRISFAGEELIHRPFPSRKVAAFKVPQSIDTLIEPCALVKMGRFALNRWTLGFQSPIA